MGALSTDDARTATHDTTNERNGHLGGSVLEARPGGPADRLGGRWRHHAPAVVASVVGVTGLVALLVVVVGLGLLLVHVFADTSVTGWDTSVNEWFAAHRTTTLNAVTRWGSDFGATLTIVGVALVASIALAIARRWDAVQLIVVALVLEVSVFLIATVLVDRPRPSVPRLDVSPPTASYPSGHTAAAIALYGALALITSELTRNAILRAMVWILAVALPIVVGVSRLYRGMHHPTDVLASVILGIGALLVGVLAARAASAVAERRRAPASVHAR